MWKSTPLLAITNPPAVPAQAARISPQRAALAGLSLAMLLSSLGTSSASVALPELARAFAAPAPSTQWVVLAYLLAVTTLSVSAGRLGDLLGARRLLLAGIALFTAGALLAGAAATLGMLVSARALQGLGAALMMALSVALAAETAAPENRGRAMGLIATMSAAGTAMGPSLGGLLIATAGWQAIFFIHAPLGLLAFRLIQRHVSADHPPQTPQTPRPMLDVAGTAWLALTLAVYALAMTLGRARFGTLNAALLLAAMAGAAMFARTEARAASPLIQPALFRTPGLRGSLAAGALVATVMMATLVVGPFYLAAALGLNAAAAGLAMTTGPLVAALAGMPAGRLVDRFGAARMVTLGVQGVAAGCVLLAVLPRSTGIAGYLLPITLITAAYALFQTANNTGVMQAMPASQRGVASGMLSLARNFGLITGASVMGLIFTAAAAVPDLHTASASAISSALHVTFAAAAGLAVLAWAAVGRQQHTPA